MGLANREENVDFCAVNLTASRGAGAGYASPSPRRGLQKLEDAVDGTPGAALTDPDADDAVQPGIFRRLRFEERCDAEVVVGRIDRLAPLEAGDEVGRPVADAAIGHADERGVRRLQYQANVEGGAAVAADVLPVGAAVEHLPGKTMTLEDPARHDADAAIRAGGRADDLERAHVKAQNEKRLGLHAPQNVRKAVIKRGCHELAPFPGTGRP